MRFVRTICLISLFSLFFQSPLQASGNEILAVDKAFSQMSIEQGERAAYAHYLSKNAVSLENDKLPDIGRDHILSTFADPTAGPVAEAEWNPMGGKVAASGDMAYTWGTFVVYRPIDDGTKQAYHGKYTTVWIKEDGDWKIAVDIGNDSPGPSE